MIIANELSVGLAKKLSKYYDFIVEDGECRAEAKRYKEDNNGDKTTEKRYN